MKGITPVIAIIILLLITVSLAGMGWTYISQYAGGLTAYQIDIVDSFCIGSGEVRIIVKNIGTGGIDVSEISVTNFTTGAQITTETWNVVVIGEQETSTMSHSCSGDCRYRLHGGAGIAKTVILNC
ncbi:MAG: hypothetical protein JSV63_02365 [Candidatus Aenigmatarchaeota archaeon]|nr:MAG: hypothetical protein JSV63_02365 [Candidatus Aenigmarchaeota archaeon]